MSDAKISALTNYTNPDPAIDMLPIVDTANTTTKRISRNNLLGLTSAPVGLTDSQTMTNKILTAPTISSPVLSGTITGTYTLAGTPTFPAAVVTLTGSQTLTNKILTSPTINSPTITNASITADAITGFSSANTGTIFGAAFTSGTLGTAGLAANAVTFAKLASTIFSGQLSTQANAGTSGGNMWWVNLGGIKILWGLGAVQSIGTGGTNFTFILPTFFTTFQLYEASSVNVTVDGRQYSCIDSTTFGTNTVHVVSTSGTNGSTCQQAILLIGT